MKLNSYNTGDYTIGASSFVFFAWYFVGQPLFGSYFIPFSSFKVFLLRLFGASIGESVRIKTGITIKFPWRLTIGAHSWIGQNVWIDNLAQVTIGSHCCISQGAFLCTGNHNWSKDSFDLQAKQIELKDHSWVGAKAVIGPGVTIHEGAVLTISGVASSDLAPWTIYKGNPATEFKSRPNSKSDSFGD